MNDSRMMKAIIGINTEQLWKKGFLFLSFQKTVLNNFLQLHKLCVWFLFFFLSVSTL